MSDIAIAAQNLTKKFDNFTAVDSLNLEIPKANIYGFLGPNGSGKTTTTRMLTGLLIPTFGSANVLGFNLPQDSEKLRPNIGYMTQKFSLYEDLTVEENLSFVSKIYGIGKRVSANKIQRSLANYSLTTKSSALTKGLSGGQKQRLALAAATLHEPKLLILDEPTSAVDPENRRDFWEKLFELCELGTTILVSTHYMDEAERCHKLAIMDRGILRGHGTPEKLMANMHANIYELTGPNLNELKKQLLKVENIISVAQQGIRLRVLTSNKIGDPYSIFKNLLPEQNDYNIEQVRPSLEDVFVFYTQDENKADDL